MVNEKAAKIGKRIQIIRHLKQLSQKEVAKIVGITQTHLCNIERGKSNCTMDNLIKLSKVFQCPMKNFFIDIDTPNQTQAEKLTFDDLIEILRIIKKQK